MKKKLLLAASLAALGLASAVVAWAGVNAKQNDTGGMCWEFTSGVTNTDAWCWSSLGVFDLDPATTAADSAATNDMFELKLDTPVDTTGTNTHNALTLDVDIGNATGGTNTARGLQIDSLTGDAQVTEQGINIGTGWDAGIQLGSAMNLDDGTTDSPVMTFQDATDETVAITKTDAGALSITSSATGANDGINLLGGNLLIGNGTPGETINGEDVYIEGISEFDGTANFDGTADFDGAITVDSTTIQENILKFAGRGQFQVCGDIATVNANTVYYGPSQVVIDSATSNGVTCDTNAAGNTTEATADAPIVASLAWVPLGMVCYSTDMGATGSPLTYTFRAGAAYDAGAITLSIADNILSGASPANTIGTTAIAADTAVSVALTSSGDVGAGAFVCNISYAY